MEDDSRRDFIKKAAWFSAGAALMSCAPAALTAAANTNVEN